ncbi:RagB/SusD family nutrient uptake outer membrane protein [Sphingobacterium puteale]|uniref:RagB/SusD family nutrient uptake outer membrane protein n=1 Tax=Sphingobacterium puteale TaxID=2420510 RepID=A0A420VUC9_9SPHI|nr:RagB/SusD family nutrient uptake outer membrane protein [Sphingobacterium puteale]RKO69924.1 RagB/SusD family nutrient uptake outer membrane protein [Sphingobacterium puteale]
MKITLIIILCLFTSCGKFLDEKSSNKLAVPVSISDLQALLDNQSMINDKRTPAFLQASADDYFLPENVLNGLAAEEKLLYTWKPFDYYFGNDWSAAYHVVYTANYCLERLEKIPKTAENTASWDNVYGSARFLKAYCYLGLVWAFCREYDPDGSNDSRGIVLRNSSDFNVPSVFYTVGESYAEIIRLAEDCLQYLPEKPLVKARPSVPAAHSLLARALLSMGRYGQALIHSEKALLIDKALINFNSPADGIAINSETPFGKFTKETIFYSEMSQNFNIFHPGRAFADTALMALFEAGDLRLKAYYQSDGGYYKFKGTHSNTISSLFSGLTTAEMYLISAECHARAGNLAEGVRYLNTFRKSRWDASTAYQDIPADSKEKILGNVLDERRRELAMRGIRWSDIKRLNREGYGITLKRVLGEETIVLQPGSDSYILPLPKDLEKFFE